MRAFLSRYFLKICLVLALLLPLSSSDAEKKYFFPLISLQPFQAAPSGIRGVWATPSDLYTKDDIDLTLERAQAGGFNTIFACIFFQGQTLFDSVYARKHSAVKEDFNPLAYLVEEAHQRNIDVHAWFITGNTGERKESPLLIDHPDWKLIGQDGGPYGWLNFARPDVREFIGNLASEVIERYGVDGVHLDYIRYPDPEWGFDTYSMETFQEEYGLDANLLRYADLPAYGLLSGNPLTDPGTATVLAIFSNGYPAVTINQYGEGEVILLNWEANKRNLAVNSEILNRSLLRLLQDGGDIYLLRSETNAAKYGYDGLEEAKIWLDFLGWDSEEVGESEVSTLSPESVLVLPGIYLITAETASQMADFVSRGGGIVIIDGPTPSIGLADVQAITGMRSRGKYFMEPVMITATGEHPLIPTSEREADLDLFMAWDMAWKDFRREGVTFTVQEVYRRVKSASPDTIVSTVIPADPETSMQRRMQDWQAWLQTRSVDLLMPLLYVDQLNQLKPDLEQWESVLNGDARSAFGLISYTGGNQARVPKPPAQILDELDVLRQEGITNFSIYDIGSLTDEQLAVLSEDAQAGYPPP